ncbi:MAG: response regulator transcription factor, partial [Flavobacteriales bacterium]
VLSSNYEIITAKNGKYGLELANIRIPDLILSDIMMPDMDGFIMLEKLKQNRETSHIPIIFLTAKDTETDKERGYDLGVDSYLTKPVSPKLLHKRIENLLAKRKAVYAEVLGQLSAADKDVEVSQPKVNPDLWRENIFVQEFVSLVEECIQDEVLDVATLADKMNMSQSTLYRKLKALTGKNINQLVRKVKIQKAAKLLRSGQYNVTEVALMVGINSSIYFRQCFKEEFGQLPSEYQKNNLKG